MLKAYIGKIQNNIHYALLFIVVYFLANSGGVDPFAQSFGAICLAVLLCVVSFMPAGNGDLRRIFTIGALALLLLAGVALLQSVRLENHPYEHPVWKIAREHLAPVSGAISVAPEQTRAAIVALSPAIGFLVAIRLFQTTEEATNFLQKLVFLASSVAIFGVFQHIFMPGQSGFARKDIYLESLTSVFINRNSAGTFIGIGVTLSLGLACYYLRFVDLHLLKERFLGEKAGGGVARPYRQFMLFAALAFVQVIALMMTQSRGAYIATFFAVGLLFGFLGQHRMTAGQGPSIALKYRRIAQYLLPLLGLLLVFWFFGGRTAHRLEAQGIDEIRLCIFQSTWRAILDNFWLGTGFGTFAEVFPAYRDAECAGILGIVDTAHNTFLEGALGFGAVFIVLLPVLYLVLIVGFFRGWRQRRRYRFAPVAGLAVLLLITVHSLVDFSLQIPAVSTFFAISLGTLMVIATDRSKNT